MACRSLKDPMIGPRRFPQAGSKVRALNEAGLLLELHALLGTPLVVMLDLHPQCVAISVDSELSAVDELDADGGELLLTFSNGHTIGVNVPRLLGVWAYEGPTGRSLELLLEDGTIIVEEDRR